MKMINESEIFETWTPIIESKTSIKDSNKIEWLSKYCHFHQLNESMDSYATLSNITGQQGAPLAPTRTANGSGDKFPSLLPLAIQVAAKTIGFDIVPVIPMSGPTGVLSYLDYVYGGGRIDSASKPVYIKIDATGTYTAGTTYYGISQNGANPVIPVSGDYAVALTYIGKSRIDGYKIFKVGATSSNDGSAWAANTAVTIANVFDGVASIVSGPLDMSMVPVTTASVTASAQLVTAVENHIAGFTGAGATDTQAHEGPYASTSYVGPMNRETGETTYFNGMGLKTFTKFVEAKTYQAAANVTTEQIQDLQKQFGIDLVSMIENALVNEVSQSINKHILGAAFALGVTNATAFAASEGSSLDLNLSALPTTGTFENLQTTQRRIFSRILAAGNVVANRGRRGPSNFVVTNAKIATVIQDISQFVAAPFANTANQNVGSLYPVGSLAGMTVYVDQNMSWNDTRVLVGRKGADDEPGLKFMPYLMAESIQTISEGTMSPKVAVKSRYALVEAGFHPETMYITFTITSSGIDII